MPWHTFELSDQHAHLLYVLAHTWQVSPDRAIEVMLEQTAPGHLTVQDALESANAHEPHDG